MIWLLSVSLFLTQYQIVSPRPDLGDPDLTVMAKDGTVVVSCRVGMGCDIYSKDNKLMAQKDEHSNVLRLQNGFTKSDVEKWLAELANELYAEPFTQPDIDLNEETI